MKKRWIVLLGATLVVSSMVGAQSVLARGHSASGSAAQRFSLHRQGHRHVHVLG